MNRQEIKKVVDRTWGLGKSDTESILREINLNSYKFDKNEILEIFNSIYGKRGLTTTPNNLSELIALIGKSNNPKSVIDICCGTGNILNYLNGIENLKGIDINYDIIQLAKNINPNIEFIATDTLLYNFEDNKYDLVIGSLPFGARTFDNKPLGIELMKKGLSLLANNGTAIFIVNEGVLMGQSLSEKLFRDKIITEYALDMVVSLPIGAFYPYTSVKTSILVIRNGKPNRDVYMPLFDDNSNEIIANFKNHEGSFYLPVSMIGERFDRNYHLQISIIQEKLKGREVKRLSEMAQIIKGQPISKNNLKNSGKYLVYNRKDKNGRKCYVDEIQEERTALKPNDLVISLLTADKNIYIHDANSVETVVTENFVIIRSSENDYINTYLQSEEGKEFLWQQADGFASGTVMSRINLSTLSDFLIPILPLSELNFVSKEWLREASSENMLQLEKKLKGLISIYEIGSSHLTLTKEILAKVIRIEEKIDTAITLLEKLTFDVTTIKNNKRDEEEKISRIYFEIDQKLNQLTKEKEKELLYYQSEIKKWLDNWELLHSSSSIFITSAELIYDFLPKGEDTDYSPFIIQYCRSLENEILKKLFEAYHSVGLIDTNKSELVKVDLEKEKNGSDKRTARFAKKVLKDDSQYELGTMSFIMGLIEDGGNTLSKSPLLQNFRSFTLTYFEDKVLQKDFLDNIKNITENYRNKSAHPYILTLETAKECQKLIRHILIEFLHHYKLKI